MVGLFLKILGFKEISGMCFNILLLITGLSTEILVTSLIQIASTPIAISKKIVSPTPMRKDIIPSAGAVEYVPAKP